MELEKIPLKTVYREPQLWLLVLLGLIYCHRPLFLGETYFYRDLYEHSIPQKRLFVELLRQGELPLWDPYVHGGQPFLADINNLVLYPANFLYLILPFFTAFNLEIALHLILHGTGAYVLSRCFRFSPGSSLVTGLTYQFCGFTLSLMNLLNRFLSSALLPWVLLFWTLYLQRGDRKSFLLLIAAAVTQFLAGSPEMTLITFLLMLVWGTILRLEGKKIGKVFQKWLLAGIFTAGIVSVQILPTIEMLLQSSRKQMDFESITVWSLHPKRLPETIVPKFFGRTDALARQDYWGSNVEGVPFTYAHSIYWSLLVLVFAFAGGLGKEDHFFSRRLRSFLLILSGASLLLSFGRNLPGYEWLYNAVPFFKVFRYPIKFMFAASLPIALLAGYGVETRFVTMPSKRFVQIVGVLFLVFLSLALAVIFRADFSNNFQEFFFGQSSPRISAGLAGSFYHAAILFTASFLLFLMRRKRAASYGLIWILAGLVAVDLLVAAKGVNPSAPRDFFTRTPRAAEIVRSKIGTGKLYREEAPATVVLRAPSNDIVWQNMWSLEVLNYYTGRFYQIPVIFHVDYDQLANVRVMDLRRLLESIPWNRRESILSASGVSVIITDANFDDSASLRKSTVIRNPSRLLFYLYENAQYLPPARLVYKIRRASDVRGALAAYIDPNFHPMEEVVLEGRDGAVSDTSCEPGSVRWLQRSVNRQELEYDSKCDAILVFPQPYYKGWKVRLNDRELPVLRANYAFSAVHVPAGKHKIRKMYRPTSVLAGLLLSASFLFCLILLTIKHPAFKRPKESHEVSTTTGG